jgi:hypothetical protein
VSGVSWAHWTATRPATALARDWLCKRALDWSAAQARWATPAETRASGVAGEKMLRLGSCGSIGSRVRKRFIGVLCPDLKFQSLAPKSRRQATEKVGREEDSSMPAGAKQWPETGHLTSATTNDSHRRDKLACALPHCRPPIRRSPETHTCGVRFPLPGDVLPAWTAARWLPTPPDRAPARPLTPSGRIPPSVSGAHGRDGPPAVLP